MDEEKKNGLDTDVSNNGTQTTVDDPIQGKDQNGAPVGDPLPRDVFIERIHASRPDGKYDEDEQELYRQAMSLMDELGADSKKHKDFAEKLVERFRENPEEAQAILDYMGGMPLVAAIRQNMGDEALTMQEGDEGWEEYQRAGETRKADRERLMAYAKEIQDNATESDKAFNEWAEEQGLDDEQKQAVWDLIHQDIENTMHGKISKDLLNRYRNSLNHDSDVEAAKKQGEIDGKNAAIEAKRKKMEGSGLPNGQAAGGDNGDKQLSAREQMAQRLAGIRLG